ncbi:MAG: tetratricopeptide repeat protein [Syntrophales bacterium]
MKTLFRNRYFVPILVAFVGVLAYSNTFTSPFQFDDEGYIVNNPVIRDFRSFLHPRGISSGYTLSPTGMPVPLRLVFMTRILGTFSLAINYYLHGLNVTGYHVFNLLIHILNAWLVYFFLRQTFRRNPVHDSKSGNEATGVMALLGALLFLCHPVQTHAVTYITSRFVLLASFLSLLSLVAYMRFRLATTGARRYALIVISIVSLVAAMLSKEFSFTMPFIIALYDFSFLPGTVREKLRALAPMALTLPIIPVLLFIQQGSIGALGSTMRTITAADVTRISRVDYLLTQFRVIVLYLRLLVLPIGQNIDHDIPVEHSLASPAVLGSFLLLLGLLILAGHGYYCSIRNGKYPGLRMFSFGIIWFFIALSVESSLIPLGELCAEYRVYLPSVGIVMAFTSFYTTAIHRFFLLRKAFYAAALVLLILLCTATLLRNTVWRSEIALWEDAARKSPAKLRPHQNLGTYYSMQGRFVEARDELQTAIRIDPRNYQLHNNLGIVYRQQGDLGAAMKEYLKTLDLEPSDPMAHYNIGNIYLAQGNLPEAIREYKACLEIAADYDEAHNNLGIAYEKSGQVELAIMEFKRAISLNPENIKARNNLAMCMRKAGRE